MNTVASRTLLITTLASAVLVAASPLTTRASAATAYSVSRGLVASTVQVGTKYTLSGSVSPSASGKPVTVQRYVSGSWRYFASLTLSSHSTYSMTRSAPTTPAVFVFRVIKPAGAGYALGVSRSIALHIVRSRFSVSLSLPGTATPGQTVTASGSVSPAAPGAAVVLQRLVGGSWHAASISSLSSTSTYKFTQTLSAFGSYTYRVSKGYTATYAAGVSPSRTSTVTSTVLREGQQLASGDFLTSEGGQYRLTMQPDGNLVESVYGDGRAIWTSGSGGHPGAVAVQQGDGNLVIYRGSAAVWSSGTGGNSDDGQWFTGLQGDANVVVYDGGTPRWDSGHWNTQITPSEQLRPGWYLKSPNQQYRLTMQGDGNLVEVVNDSSRPVWSSGTSGHAGAWAVEQSDGNFVIYPPAGGTALWNAGTSGAGTVLALQSDSNVVQYNGSGTATWASSTINDSLVGGEKLTSGQFLNSHGGGYQLIMQGDGNLVQYQAGTATWSSGTSGNAGAYVVMQGDGNLVVYNAGKALWSSGTAGHPGAVMYNQGDGNIVLYAGGLAIWASHTPAKTIGGACNAFTGAYALGASYDDGAVSVPACGPRPGYGGGPAVHPYPGSLYTPGYQCVEFSERYLYYKYGATMGISTNGDQIVDHYASKYSNLFAEIPNGTANAAPVQGDVISWSSVSSFASSSGGHTAVVQSSSVDGNGNGTISVVEENYQDNGGQRTISVSNWHLAGGSYPYAKWLHHR